jgi:hypothetical protein
MKLPVSVRSAMMLAALSGLLSAACDNAVSYSSPVGINLKAKGDDLKSGVVVDEKAITTENGNPYGAFVARAREALGGKSPARIEVTSGALLLGGSSRGVTNLDQVLTGRADIQFVMNDTNNSFGVAHVESPRGVGPVQLVLDFDPAAVAGEDLQKLVNGSFKVVLRAPAAAAFVGNKEMQADLQVTLEFAAYP